MLRRCVALHRSVGAAQQRRLRRSLRLLRVSNQKAKRVLDERRRQAFSSRPFSSANVPGGKHARTGKFSASNTPVTEAMLPENVELENAIAFTLSERGDARMLLEFTQRLMNSTLISLASPVGSWDPYDVKPQVFALDTNFALPVFTSLTYLRHFCEKFQFEVRDPSGTLWSSGRAADGHTPPATPLALPDVTRSEWFHKYSSDTTAGGSGASPEGGVKEKPHQQQAAATEAPPPIEVDADVLSSFLEDDVNLAEEPTTSHTKHKHVATAQSDPSKKGKKTKRRTTKRKGKSVRSKGGWKYMKRRHLRRKASSDRERNTLRKRKGKGKGKGLRRKAAQRPSKFRARRGATRMRVPRKGRAKKTGKKKFSAQRHASTPKEDPTAAAKRAAFWEKVASVQSFSVSKATPLPIFGPLQRSFFVGYFADIDTLLQNVAIVPDKVDIIVNPGSPLEYVLARSLTNRVLHRDHLVLQAFQAVERTLRGEFHRFFAKYCPEVESASSACVPQQAPDLTPHNELQYDIVIIVTSSDFDLTLSRVAVAKQRAALLGHATLQILPPDATAPFVRQIASEFYQGSASRPPSADVTRPPAMPFPGRPRSRVVGGGIRAETVPSAEEPLQEHRRLEATPPHSRSDASGVFQRRGSVATINITSDANSYYHDPTNAYTESHAIFTEELKVNRKPV